MEKPTESQIWAYSTDNYYERESASPFRVVIDKAVESTVNKDETITYNFKTENGKGKLVYAFFGLPEGVYGDRDTGVISGAFEQSGIFTFGCEVADQIGNSA